MKRSALRLLAYRERSRKELVDRLGEGAEPVVDELARLGLQDDGRFAKEWTRGKAARLYGPVRVRRELLQRGVDEGVIEAVLEETYGGGKERELAVRALLKHRGTLEGKESVQRTRTLYSYMLRHGFHAALVAELVAEEMRS
jgi:regulatory protein